MRNGQNKHRMRGRSRSGKSHNPLTRVYESNGPDVKIRGTANHVAEKYIQLARDATASGDPVAAENYYQHAEHYFRLIAAAQEQFRQSQPFQQRDSDDSFDGDDDSQPNYAEPHSPQPYQQQPREPQGYQQREQPYPRDNQPHYQQRQDNRGDRGDNRREGRHENRPQHQDNRQAHQGNGAQDETIDRLPSFITGGPAQGAQPNGGQDAQPSGERFPSRRNSRRRDYRGPRAERGAPEGGDDASQQAQPPAGE
jgi:hypothetical protein